MSARISPSASTTMRSATEDLVDVRGDRRRGAAREVADAVERSRRAPMSTPRNASSAAVRGRDVIQRPTTFWLPPDSAPTGWRRVGDHAEVDDRTGVARLAALQGRGGEAGYSATSGRVIDQPGTSTGRRSPARINAAGDRRPDGPARWAPSSVTVPAAKRVMPAMRGGGLPSSRPTTPVTAA